MEKESFVNFHKDPNRDPSPSLCSGKKFCIVQCIGVFLNGA